MMREEVKTLKEDRSRLRGRVKRLQFLCNYILAAMNEKDFDSDPMIKKSFNKCDKAGDLKNE